MTTNQQMFLLAAEELSFTRAAARAYVSQQCLSDHIRRMEESYGVRLFDRSPRLRLTAALRRPRRRSAARWPSPASRR